MHAKCSICIPRMNTEQDWLQRMCLNTSDVHHLYVKIKELKRKSKQLPLGRCSREIPLAFWLYHFLTLIIQNKKIWKFCYSPGTDVTLPNFSTMIKNVEVLYIIHANYSCPFSVLTMVHQGYLKNGHLNLFKITRNKYEAALHWLGPLVHQVQ